MTNLLFKKIIVIFAILACIVPSSVFAVQIKFEPEKLSFPQNKPFTATILLNSEGESVNTVEGTVLVAKELGESITITDSGSIITYWVSRPEWDPKTRSIKFSGAVPGGYSGSAGILFSIVVPGYNGNQLPMAMSLVSTNAYLNDGLGTSTRVSTNSLELGFGSSPLDPEIQGQLYIDDSRPDDIAPEGFDPQVSRDERLFNGRWFINFSTLDKQSGIDHYEIQESVNGKIDSGKWRVASSPYHELEDQNLNSYIFVLAVDRKGNETIVQVFPRNPLSWHDRYGDDLLIIGGTILVILASAYIINQRGKGRKKSTV